MSRRALMIWAAVHTWSSLVCTAFLLFLCVTGLPLIFHDEIDGWLAPPAPLPAAVPGALPLSLDRLMDTARAAHPGDVPLYLAFGDSENGGRRMTFTTAPRADAGGGEMHLQELNRLTGRIIPSTPGSPMATILALHTDLLLGFWAELFLGAMGLLFVAALVSGVVLYVPFTARMAFGTVRRDRSPRVRRLDRHNLIGIATLAWALVVGLTGTINTLVVPITAAWKADRLAALGPPGPIVPVPPGAIQRAYDTARAVVPGLRPQFMAFPGVAYSSDRHIAVFFHGATPATDRLLTAAFVDAATGRLAAVTPMPWYMQALLLAEPLHFGDYGGWPMKVAWALADLLTIWVLVGGFRLWLERGRGQR